MTTTNKSVNYLKNNLAFMSICMTSTFSFADSTGLN